MKSKFTTILFIIISLKAAEWGVAPEGWDDFQFGLVEANTEPWKTQLTKALDKGVQIDYRYRYCTSPEAALGWIFSPWYNYAKGPQGIKPSITIYMVAGNIDDIGKISQNGQDQSFMKKYFDAVKVCADSTKGYNPIFVIEPDVWGYFLQHDNSGLGDKFLNQTCYINNLGYDCLKGFNNTFKDLPGAIIAMLKTYAPDCYAGILMAHWSFNSFWLPSPEENATNAIPFLEKMLRDPYKGDFLAVEKYGADAGSTGGIWYWDDQQNADFVTWCKTLAQGIDLPLCGWQTSIGYKDEVGYPDLPNTSYKYQDTFFPYFFENTNDFIDAGFIGFLAGCANAGQGTVYGTEIGEYDNGWFLDRLEEFNNNRPYNLNLNTPIIKNNKTIHNSIRVKITSKNIYLNSSKNNKITLFSLSGKKLLEKKLNQSVIKISDLCKSTGTYLIQIENAKGITNEVLNFLY